MVVTDFYTSEEYLKRNPDWHKGAAQWKAQSILQVIKRNHLTFQTVCDIGCGAGDILQILQQTMAKDISFVGYDIAPQAIAFAKEHENEHLHFQLADFMEGKPQFFDLILIIDVLEHFENCFQVLRDLHPQSTYKILQLPLDLSVNSLLNNKLPEYRHTTGHLHFFTKDIALEVLKDTGYEIIDTFYCRQPLDTTPWGNILRQPLQAFTKLLRVAKRSLFRLPGTLCYAINPDYAVRFFGGWRLMVLIK